MGLDVTLMEKPRTFDVLVGSKTFGRVRSYSDPDDDNKDALEFLAETRNDDGTFSQIDWFNSLRKAAKVVLDETFYEGKVDRIVRMRA